MFGLTFFRSQIAVHGHIIPMGKLEDWPYVQAYICDQPHCDCVELFWLDRLQSSSVISCRKSGCPGSMRLYHVPMEQVKSIPAVWERVWRHIALQS